MKHKRQVALVLLAMFIDLVGFGMVIPILPFAAERFGADGFMLGIFVASFSLMQFLFAPVWGMLSDKVGRRPVILIGLLGGSISFLVFGLSTSLLMLFLSRVLSGIFTAATLPSVQAYMADITSDKDRARGFGLLGMAFGLGFVFGPAIGGFLSSHGFLFPGLFASALSFVNFLGALLWLPETYKPTGVVKKRKLIDIGKLHSALNHPAVGSLILTFAIVSFAFSNLEATYALYGERVAGLNAQSIGIIFTMVGIIITVVQGGLIGKITNAIGERRPLLIGLAVMSLGYFVVGTFAKDFASLMAMTSLISIGNSLTFPTVNALISINSRKDEQGEVMGINQSAGSLARVVGPIWGGFLFVNVGIGWPFRSAALFVLIALILAYFRVRKVPLS